jgi:signal transduction histidine kinase
MVDGDPHLVARVVQNLIDNAMRFAPNGGEVTVSCRNLDARVEFSVADNGPGIPTSDLPHIFSPMFRGETSRNRSTGGAGLGLTIARRILRAHGGDLTVQNNDQGALFVGWLPGIQAQPGRSMAAYVSAAPSTKSEQSDS